MNGFLLDVNAFIALSWPDHSSHVIVQDWFAANARKGWATCAITEAGFVRITSNPSFSSRAVSPLDAARALRLTVEHPSHRFWPSDLPLVEAIAMFGRRLVGHQQVTDAYLLGLAIHKKGKLATLDKGLFELVDRDDIRSRNIELISRPR